MHTRIYIIEDHAFMRTMLQEFLNRVPDLEVCGTAATAEEALQNALQTEPTLLLVDVALPGMSGIDLAREAQARWPDLPCLMLSGHHEPAYIEQALAAGARGYVLKGNPDAIVDAVQEVLAGNIYLSEQTRSLLDAAQ